MLTRVDIRSRMTAVGRADDRLLGIARAGASSSHVEAAAKNLGPPRTWRWPGYSLLVRVELAGCGIDIEHGAESGEQPCAPHRRTRTARRLRPAGNFTGTDVPALSSLAAGGASDGSFFPDFCGGFFHLDEFARDLVIGRINCRYSVGIEVFQIRP